MVAYLPADDAWDADHLTSLLARSTAPTWPGRGVRGARRRDARAPQDAGCSSCRSPTGAPASGGRSATSSRADDLELLLWRHLPDARGDRTRHLHVDRPPGPAVARPSARPATAGSTSSAAATACRPRCGCTRPTAACIDEVGAVRAAARPAAPPAGGLRVLLVGELAFNPERVLALEERGHRLLGLWTDDGLGAHTVGPLPFGHVRDVPSAGGASAPRRRRRLRRCSTGGPCRSRSRVLRERPRPAVRLALQGGAAGLRAPRQLAAARRALTRAPTRCCSRPRRSAPGSSWRCPAGSTRRAPACWTATCRWPSGSPASGRRGCPSRTAPCTPRSSAGRSASTPTCSCGSAGPASTCTCTARCATTARPPGGPPRSRAAQAQVDTVHVHPKVEQPDWVRVLSRYDAGWLHRFRADNGGDLRRAVWDDLNAPARIPTYASAGLPMLQQASPGVGRRGRAAARGQRGASTTTSTTSSRGCTTGPGSTAPPQDVLGPAATASPSTRTSTGSSRCCERARLAGRRRRHEGPARHHRRPLVRADRLRRGLAAGPAGAGRQVDRLAGLPAGWAVDGPPPYDLVVGHVLVEEVAAFAPTLQAVTALEAAGAPLLNPVRALLASADKHVTAAVWAAAGLPQPRTYDLAAARALAGARTGHGAQAGLLRRRPAHLAGARPRGRRARSSAAWRADEAAGGERRGAALLQEWVEEPACVRLFATPTDVLARVREGPPARRSRHVGHRLPARLRGAAGAWRSWRRPWWRTLGGGLMGVDVLVAQDGRLLALEANAPFGFDVTDPEQGRWVARAALAACRPPGDARRRGPAPRRRPRPRRRSRPRRRRRRGRGRAGRGRPRRGAAARSTRCRGSSTAPSGTASRRGSRSGCGRSRRSCATRRERSAAGSCRPTSSTPASTSSPARRRRPCRSACTAPTSSARRPASWSCWRTTCGRPTLMGYADDRPHVVSRRCCPGRPRPYADDLRARAVRGCCGPLPRTSTTRSWRCSATTAAATCGGSRRASPACSACRWSTSPT